ncbi:MAG: hypothetical protein DSM107014_13560 [Gomphosphaeria aponina SAG 52.96 = DSM 107014]|uniref:Uncharacterized protein n=1 Tax=Gomphosphaeria aponina SAG 52.96 = DSM 107014 TaxID=1521640 RepID=A0A941GSY5_9CHRO|nr:hypothetical protein [Gomphosphaeria aponina SAG 52.96 = DSM 107014]
MNIQLVDSLAQIINSLTREEKQILQTKINLTDSLKDNDKEHQSWHEFINNTYGSIDDESFIRHPQGEFEPRELIE